jgi:S-methylmethionine-dependent homocysteine/selenocysteine methylase
MRIARIGGTGFVLDSATWRANREWGEKLGYDATGLDRINRRAIALLEILRDDWERPGEPCVISGAIGPAGDGYKAGRMSVAEAESYHIDQVATFADTAADMVTAFTMNTVEEATGIALAARGIGIPCAISFTVETDGRLATGATLREAVEAVDDVTGGSPVYYMINCAHPTHFVQALAKGETWIDRIHGVRANASALSHAELDESETLDAGDPADLGQRYAALRRDFPGMRILGGCCGTDQRHVSAICEACLPRAA